MRRHRSVAGLLVLLLAAGAILEPAQARGLRSQTQTDPANNKQQQAASKPAATSAGTAAASGGLPVPPQPPQTTDEDKQDVAALSAYAEQRAGLQDLHEEMLAFMEVKEKRQGLQGLHEEMVHALGKEGMRALFVSQEDVGGRRLQFGIPGVGIPGVGRIPGVGGIGMPGIGGIGVPGLSLGSLYGAAQTGANMLRQGAYTAVELARMKDEYERRCALGKYKDGSGGDRKLQALLAQGARYVYGQGMEYARDMPCPTAEQRAEYERMYEHATGAQERALAALAEQGDAIAREQAARALLHRQTRAMQGPATSMASSSPQEQQKRPVPVLSGADILARQQQLLGAYGAAPRSDMAAAILRRGGDLAGEDNPLLDLIDADPIGGSLAGGLMGIGGNGLGAMGGGAAGLAGLREDAFQQFAGGDALRRAGYQRGAGLGGLAGGRLGDELEDEAEDELEDDDDATIESLLGPKRLGESREERHARKQALRAERKAARLARKAERKARRPGGRLGADN